MRSASELFLGRSFLCLEKKVIHQAAKIATQGSDIIFDGLSSERQAVMCNTKPDVNSIHTRVKHRCTLQLE